MTQFIKMKKLVKTQSGRGTKAIGILHRFIWGNMNRYTTNPQITLW